ncbi:MAG: sialidase family protein [Actinomycetes bacterium]
MSRRRIALAAACAVGLTLPFVLLPGASAAPLAGAHDTTSPYGPFGFTTKGLGKTGSYGEPSLAVAPDGRHVVTSTPGCAGVCYWYSADNGATWKTTETSGGGGDSELDFLPDGTLVSADLAVQNSVMHRSFDFGKTWEADGTAGSEQDRQWLGHSPNATRKGGTLYLAYHDFVAEAEFIATSKDGGKSWTTGATNEIVVNSAAQFAATPAGVGCTAGNTSSLVDQGVNTFSGPILVDRNGKDIYVLYSISDVQSNIDPTSGVPPFGPTRAIVVAHSGDAGATWTNRYVVCADLAIPPSQETTNGAIFPWGFLDPSGTVYVVYNSTHGEEGTQHFHQYYVYSKDKGATWSKPVRLDTGLAMAKGASVYATGAPARSGTIDVAWYQTDNGDPSNDNSTWVPHFAQVTGADTGSPHITQQAIVTIPNHKGGICLQGILCGVAPGSADRSLADFFELAVNPKTGLAGIAYADNNRLGTDSKGNKVGEVVYAAQTSSNPSVSTCSCKPPTRAKATGTGLAATGMSSLVGIAALALLVAAYVVRRKQRSP